MLDTKKKHFVPDMVRHILLSWLLAVTIEYLLLPGMCHNLDDLSGLAQMSLIRVVVITLFGTAMLTLLSHYKKIGTIERWGMVGIFAILAACTMSASFSWAYLVVCILLLIVLFVFGRYGWDSSPEPQTDVMQDRKSCIWLTVGITVLFFLFVCVWTVCRVYSFNTPSYDFGIFSQMFYHMKESGLPMTTIERDGLLSHFHVHMSPIYYLMLPFYYLVPEPATLQVLQAAVVASSVIPLWKIGKQHGLTDWQRVLLCGILLLFPAFSGGTGYDIHENCFLTPLILWLFYGIDRKNTLITALAAVLTLLVKEDAAVYVAVIGLWLIVKSLVCSHKREHHNLVVGIVLFFASLIWFFLVTSYLAKIGDGVMTDRYDNFIYDGSSSLLTVIKAVLMNPMKAVYECVDSEKLSFIAMTMLPLLGLPLFTRRYERYILLIPYLLVNLMSDYTYQHDIFFQYTFGSTACLMYLTVVNLVEIKIHWKRSAALLGVAVIGAFCFGGVVVPKAISYPVQCVQHGAEYQQIRNTLSKIPEEASVATTTFYSTFLSQREVLYDVKYCTKEHLLEAQYIVLNEDGSFENYEKKGNDGKENLTELLLSEGYTVYDQIPEKLTIYRKSK